MKKMIGLIAVLAAVAVVAVPALAGPDGDGPAKHPRVKVMKGDVAHPAGFEAMDLENLRDGEVRTIGGPGHEMTVERRGDVVIIRNDALEGELREIECNLGEDECQVWAFDGNTVVHGAEGHGMKMFVHRSDCEGDDCEEHVAVRSRVLVQGAESCEHGEDCEIVVHTDVDHGDGEHRMFVIDANQIGHGFQWSGGLEQANQAVLRCPEGDTTMHVELEEAEDTFLCPKHSTPLDRVKSRRVMIRTERQPEE